MLLKDNVSHFKIELFLESAKLAKSFQEFQTSLAQISIASFIDLRMVYRKDSWSLPPYVILLRDRADRQSTPEIQIGNRKHPFADKSINRFSLLTFHININI